MVVFQVDVYTQQVYGELKMSEMQSPVTMQKMQQAMMIANDSTLSTLLSPEDFATANKFCKENLMLDLSAAPKLKPAFLLNNVVVAAYVKHIGKFNPQEQLDTFFQSQATQNGKKVDGLETAEFQFNLLFNGYSLQRQAQLLMCTINNINTEVERREFNELKLQNELYQLHFQQQKHELWMLGIITALLSVGFIAFFFYQREKKERLQQENLLLHKEHKHKNAYY